MPAHTWEQRISRCGSIEWCQEMWFWVKYFSGPSEPDLKHRVDFSMKLDTLICCRKRDPFQDPKLGFCLTLRNELSEETHVLTKQEILLGRGTWVESRRVRGPRRTTLSHGLQSRFYGDGISFWVVFSQSFWLKVLPGVACLVQPRWMLERRILGGGWTCGVSFWPFPNSSGWWRLISSVFLTRTSCCKTTYANGYYGAWPGWKVSINVLPLTITFIEI